MALVEWNDKLRLGIPSIDQQHKGLVSLINSLHDAMCERRGQAILGSILADLVKYTAEHFTYEEQLLSLHGYRQVEAHRLQHTEFARKVREFRESVESGKVALSGPVLELPMKWLTGHICSEDEKYVRLLMAKGVR